MDPLLESLAQLNAPQALRDFASDEDPEDVQGLWDACPLAEWLPWLVPVAQISLNALVTATIEVVSAEVEDLSDDYGLQDALHLVVDALLGDGDGLDEAAQRAQDLRALPPASFRAHPGRQFGDLAGAVEQVAQATAELNFGRRRSEAARLRQAQNSARLFGTGTDIFVSEAEPELLLTPGLVESVPEQAALISVIAACAESAKSLQAFNPAVVDALRLKIEEQV